MLTKWGKAILVSALCNASDAVLPVKTLDGLTFLAITTVSSNYFPAFAAFRNIFNITQLNSTGYGTTGNGFMLGSGTTPASENDYCLETPYIGNSSVVGITASASGPVATYNNDIYEATLLVTISNPTSETKRVAEIGLRGAINGRLEGATTNTTRGILIDRTVLDEPIDIPPSGSATIEYTITIDLS